MPTKKKLEITDAEDEFMMNFEMPDSGEQEDEKFDIDMDELEACLSPVSLKKNKPISSQPQPYSKKIFNKPAH